MNFGLVALIAGGLGLFLFALLAMEWLKRDASLSRWAGTRTYPYVTQIDGVDRYLTDFQAAIVAHSPLIVWGGLLTAFFSALLLSAIRTQRARRLDRSRSVPPAPASAR